MTSSPVRFHSFFSSICETANADCFFRFTVALNFGFALVWIYFACLKCKNSGSSEQVSWRYPRKGYRALISKETGYRQGQVSTNALAQNFVGWKWLWDRWRANLDWQRGKTSSLVTIHFWSILWLSPVFLQPFLNMN